ncbi:glycosyltransferase [Zavarzinella formosa]|uniref:glycosyltransferase n=1 Tax=Zavarzinella formosa TaxID=360055 RepID=UPI0003153FFB|nr:glycosyltransferase [Zavarzinella formosa]
MRTPPRILFASYHGYFDPASGAALATRDLLELLAVNGWPCGAVCGPDLDAPPSADRAAWLAALGLSVTTKDVTAGVPHRLFHVAGSVRATVFVPAGWAGNRPATTAEADEFIGFFCRVAAAFKPDIVLTYGGHEVGRRLMVAARELGAKVVFALHNFAYDGPAAFRGADAVFVPSRFAQYEYARRRVTAAVLPCPFSWERVRAMNVSGQFITFVNPVPDKGVFVFARIIVELGRRRPDIPFLVVESRGRADWLARTGVDLVGLPTVHRMANSGNPAAFYALSRAILMPSLWNESLGRVAAEALVNGLPVVASDRGALPETLGSAGLCLPLPAHCTPESRLPPSADEVSAWCAEIERLWDDAAYHEDRRQKSLAAAGRWRPEVLLARFEEFFHRVAGT